MKINARTGDMERAEVAAKHYPIQRVSYKPTET